MKKTLLGAVTLLLFTAVLLGHTSCATTSCAAPATMTGQAHAELSAEDGTCLESFSWKPATEPTAVVLIIHGIRDHGQRYDALGQSLAAHGIAAYAFDLRGHGHSGGHRQRIDSIDQAISDVDQLAKRARADYPGKKLFVFGHSLGGLVATHYTLAHQPELAGLVLSGPALVIPKNVTSGDISGAKLFGTLLPNLPAQKVDETGFVSSDAEKKAFDADPFIDHGNVTARLARTTLTALEALSTRMEEVKLPLLVMHATTDALTDPEGSKQLSQRAQSTDKELVLLEGTYHDLLHEPRRDEVLGKVTAWVGARAQNTVTDR